MIADDEANGDENELELTEETENDPAIEVVPGFHVYSNGEHNSGPYLTKEDAQAFIDSHLSGEGEIREKVE